MKGISENFKATFKDLWPDFNLEKRAVKIPTEVLEREFNTFKIDGAIMDKPTMMEMPVPPLTKKSSKRKISSQSALSYSKFNASKDVKEIANPAKLTGKLKVPKDGLNDDPPQPIPDV
jgi:hypothetical protein